MKCQNDGCTLSAKFNVIGSENPMVCGKHQKDGMIQIRQKYCRYCNKRASYAFPNGKALVCRYHIKDGMTDIVHKKCEHPKCDTIPLYNFNGESKAVYCNTHKKDGMIDIKNKRCNHPDCETYPKYNFKGESKAVYCNSHKKDGMINIVHKRCEHPNCDTIPFYNFKGESKPLYCNTHKKDGMVDILSKRCEHPGCDSQPKYNFKGESKAVYCSIHKKDDMIDILNKRCEQPNCDTLPIYNFKGESKAVYCSIHKKDGMVDIKNKRCKHPGCDTLPTYNLKGESKAVYCSIHKKDGMIDIKHKMCKTHLCDLRIGNKYDGYCFRCFIHMFPDSPLTRNYKTKELYVVNKVQEWVTTKYPDLNITFDKKIQGGCSLRRPDMFIELLTHVVIIEVDENQHKQTSCETLRLVQLFEDVAQRPCVFIRFNPDVYVDCNGKRHKSCFKYTKQGICVIDSDKEMSRRLVPVFEALRKYLNEPQEKMIHLEQFWYDEMES